MKNLIGFLFVGVCLIILSIVIYNRTKSQVVLYEKPEAIPNKTTQVINTKPEVIPNKTTQVINTKPKATQNEINMLKMLKEKQQEIILKELDNSINSLSYISEQHSVEQILKNNNLHSQNRIELDKRQEDIEYKIYDLKSRFEFPYE